MGTSWHNYGKIYNVGHAAVDEVFDAPVVVEEKVDGSQFSFGVFDGELRCRSRGQEIHLDGPASMFDKAIETARRLQPLLHDGWTYRGEFLQKPKHISLAYDRVPEGHVILFDIAIAEEKYLTATEKLVEAGRLGLETVPLLFEGEINSAEEVRELLDRGSILGGQKIEGIVIKNYQRFQPDGKVMMAKYVSDRYREVHGKTWKKGQTTSGDIIQQIGEQLCTEARWEKAIQHKRERGELENSPRDIGPLLNEINKDVLEECKDDIKDMLFKWAWKNLARRITSGFPEWYKERLLDEQFNRDVA